MINNFGTLVIWWLITAFGYLCGWLNIKPVPLKPEFAEWLSRYVNLDGNNYKVESQSKTKYMWYHNITYTLLFSLFAFYVADLEHRVLQWEILIYTLFMTLAVFIFGFVGQVKGPMIVFTPSALKNLGWKGWLILGSVGAVLLGTWIYELYLAVESGTIGPYIGEVLCLAAYFAAMYYVFIKKDPNCEVHIHHWFIGYCLSLLYRHDHFVSNSMFFILFGIFLEGSVAFGLASIFKSVVDNEKLASQDGNTEDVDIESNMESNKDNKESLDESETKDTDSCESPVVIRKSSPIPESV